MKNLNNHDKSQKKTLILAKYLLFFFGFILILLILSFITDKKEERFYESTAHIKSYSTITRNNKRLAELIDDNDHTRILYRVEKGCKERPVGYKTNVYVRETETTLFYYFKYKTYSLIKGNICM